MPLTRSNSTASPPEHLVTAYLHSLTLTNPNLTLDATNKTLSVRPTPNQPTTVSVISGAATRHSPYIASFVGPGLLAACIGCNGSHSPFPYDSAEHVRTAIQERVLTARRVLFIIPPYGVDEVFIRNAALKAKRHDPAIQFECLTAPSTLPLDPDREFQRPAAGLSPLLLKICSATAARGYSLEEVLRVGRLVAKNLLSVGSSLRPDAPDGLASSPSEPDMSSRVRDMVARMLDPKLRDPSFVEVNSNEAVLHISGHRGLTILEMGAITAEAVKQMARWQVRPVRIYTESVSELSGRGHERVQDRNFALTILNVCNTDIGGPSMIQLLDAPAEAVGWTAFVKSTSWEAKNRRLWDQNVQSVRPSGLRCNADVIWRAATNASRALVAYARLNQLAGRDRGCVYESWHGDAAAPARQNSHAQDIWKCAKGAIDALASLQALSDDVVVLMNDILSAVAPALDNPFGAVVTIFFIALTQSFQRQSETAEEVNVGVWIYALEDAYAELSEYANHRPAMASTLEAFDTFLQVLHSTGDVPKAAKAAEQSSDTATDLGARLLCAFFAGLTRPVKGKLVQDPVAEEKRKDGEDLEPDQGAREVEAEAESPSDAKAAKGLQAEVPDQSLQHEADSPVERSNEPEAPATSAGDKHVTTTEEVSAAPPSPASPSQEPAGRTGVMTSLGAALDLRRKDGMPKEEEAAAQPAPTDTSQVTEASRDTRVNALETQQSDFDAAIEGIRSRERVPLPTRPTEETTLLDMVRQQIETLGASSKEEAVVERDADEEEYEFV